ncbi:hypothetical protein KCF3NO3_36190 [Chryseobacterium sp. KCF3-3]
MYGTDFNLILAKKLISMKKIFKAMFLLSVPLLYAQNYRFVYEYKMKPTIEKKDSVVINYMNLDTDGKKSYFTNAVKYERDSVYRVDKNYSALLKGKNYDRNLSYIIEKNYSQKTINLYDKYKSVSLVTIDQEIPKWKIENEFKKINDLNCQKAVADYKGRTWEAWFSKDFPVSDGPYKFSGLPGLVVAIKDGDNDHVFELVQIKKIKAVTALVPKNNKQMNGEEYRKLIKNYTFNPAEDIAAMNMDSKSGTMEMQLKDGYVAQLDINKLKKYGAKMDDVIAEMLKMGTNPIERD